MSKRLAGVITAATLCVPPAQHIQRFGDAASASGAAHLGVRGIQ